MKRAIKLIIISGILLLLTSGMGIKSYADEPRDKDHDGIITYYDMSSDDIENMRNGYSAGYRNQDFGYEMIYLMNYSPYVRDISIERFSSGTRPDSAYRGQASRTKSYYRHIRFDTKLYPRETNKWFGVRSWYDGEDYVAVVNCTATHSKLETPEEIFYNGRRCKVVGIELSNVYVEELTITDNITMIYKCQCPMLKTVNGGLNVNFIGKLAFRDCIYLTNMPYFPHLKTIQDLAFSGCFFMTEVLLPPGLTYVSPNAFGWYDVIKGNFDIDSPVDEDIYLGIDAYSDKYKIEGITLYYSPGSTTEETIKEYFSEEYNINKHVKTAAKDKYPGVQPPVEIDDEEFWEWLPPEDGGTYEEWVQEEQEVLSDPVKIENSISEDKREIINWLEGMLLTGDIDADMMVTLVNAMVGYANIPMDFLTEHGRDPECIKLMECYSKYASYNAESARLKEQKRVTEAAQLDAKRFKERNYIMGYICNGFSVMEEQLSKTGSELPGQISKGLTAFSAVNDVFGYVNSGESWSSAINKGIGTTVYSVAIGTVSPTPVGVFEAVVYVLFGNSKAGDAASLVGTGKHYIEFATDLYANSFYDAWLNSYQFADEVKWRAFFTIYWKNITTVLKDLTDTKNAKYGQNLTNLAYLLDTFLDPENFIYTFNGLVEMLYDGGLYSSFSKSVYDVTVKDNLFGEILFDYVASFYEESPDILTDYTKTFSATERGKQRNY